MPSDVMVALVGNKIDLETQRQVSTEEVQEYIKENSLLYIETSACLGTNVDHVFKEIGNI